MSLTFASLASALSGLTITGVTVGTHPPQRIPSGNLPIAYPRLPSGEQAAAAFNGADGLDVLTCEFAVLVETAGQSNNVTNYADTITYMDRLNAALKAAMAANHVIDGWTVRMDIELIGETAYWAVIATVRASG